MSIPIASGYPDFGRFQAQATKLYAKALVTGAIADFTVNLGYVGDVPHLRTRVTNTVGTCVVSMDFSSDAAGTVFIGNHTFSMRATETIATTFPVLGPYCVVTFFAVTTPMDVDYTFAQATVPYIGLDLSSSANVLFSFQGNLPAGTTTVEGGRIWPGPALLFAELTVANTIVTVNAVSAYGTVTFLGRVRNPNSPYPCPIYLPGQHLQVVAQNNSGAAAFFSYALTADPGLR